MKFKPTRVFYQQENMEISKKFWNSIKRSADKRKIAFEITPEDAWSVFLTQKRRCAITGILLDFSTYGYKGTASLDRLDSYKAYTLSNIQWVYSPINMMKGSHNYNYFIYLCNLVSANSTQTFSPAKPIWF